jgi:hypothetical protein
MHHIKDEISSLFAVIKCPLEVFIKKALTVAHIMLKLVV